MPAKAPLEQGKDFAVVIDAVDAEGAFDLDPEAFASGVQEMQRTLGCNYWAILHDRDFDADGERKHLHWHLVLHMRRSRRVKNAVIKGVANALGVCKDRVHVLQSYDLETDIRYLMHLDDEDKTLYPLDEVLTNDERTLVLAFNLSLNTLTFEKLENAYCLAKGSLAGIMQIIGIKLYRLNAVVIHDYVNERRQYPIAYDKKESAEDEP